jgi:cytochrome b
MSVAQTGDGTPVTSIQPASRIWDGPTRLSHGLFILLLPTAWFTAVNHHMTLHRYSGYALLGVLVFRLYWGFAGFAPSRFKSFVRGPGATLAYARRLFDRATPVTPGHNPLGAWSVLALLLFMAVQTGLGLFSVDVDGIESGPLSDWVSFDVGRICAHLHHILFNVLLGLIALHLAAIVFYFFYKRENLVAPMLHGRKRLDARLPALKRGWLRLFIGVVLAIFVVALTARGFRL